MGIGAMALGCCMGCAGQVDEPTGGAASATGGAAAEEGSVGPRARSETIFAIRRPGSEVPAGARVLLDGPALRVSAQREGVVWVQEAGDSGGCEIGDALVAYRAIRVTPRSPLAPVERGRALRVEGTVAVVDGRRVIVDAEIALVAAPIAPYPPHCERDALALAAPSLDDVLVRSAGHADAPPAADGSWWLTTCFAPEDAPLAVSLGAVSPAPWEPGPRWVTGLMERRGPIAVLVPRDAEDLAEVSGDDICL
jgi:hypothetical protein